MSVGGGESASHNTAATGRTLRFASTFVLYPATMIRDMIDQQVLELKKLWANKRQLTFQLLNLAMIVFSALMIWKGLMFLTKVGTFVYWVEPPIHILICALLDIENELMHPWRRGPSVNLETLMNFPILY